LLRYYYRDAHETDDSSFCRERNSLAPKRHETSRNWKTSSDFVTETMVVPVSSVFERVTVRRVDPIGPAATTGYLRVRVERIPEQGGPRHRFPEPAWPVSVSLTGV